MVQTVKIPDSEYQERIQKAAAKVREKGLDVLIVNSNEADFSNVRYFSRFWPLFETAGVAIAANGKAALMVGPESDVFASDVSKIKDIFVLMEYRESADPSYPELKAHTFGDVFDFLGVTGENIKIGIGGYLVTTVVMMEGLKKQFPNADISRADDIMVSLRSVKSINEIACMKEGFRIVEIATQRVLDALKPGMTELQLVGVAQQAIYENGAEYEGLPMYVFSESSTRHAISRSSYKTIGKNDIVQINLSARVDGYSPSIGMPVCMGKLEGRRREIVEFCLSAHHWTIDRVKAGEKASTIAREYYNLFKNSGYEQNYVYGPCHGTGMIEVEPPWMETNSEYELLENMTFQADSFISGDTFGTRWETGIVVTKDGCEVLSNPLTKIHELGFK